MDSAMEPINKERLDEDLVRVKDWLSKQPHLPHEFDESLLKAFVIGSKSVEVAKEKLENFCTIRTKYNHLFVPPFRKPSDPLFRKSYKAAKIILLPEANEEGRRYLMIMFTDVPKNFNIDFKMFCARLAMIAELLLSTHPETILVDSLIDASNVEPSVLTKITLQEVIFLLQFIELCIPVQCRKCIIYNAPSFVEYFLNIFIKPYVKKKLYDRISVTTKGAEALKDYDITVDLLPKDVGGRGESTDKLNEDWLKLLEDQEDWLLKTATLCADETKRPPQVPNSFGVDGTFRKLAFD